MESVLEGVLELLGLSSSFDLEDTEMLGVRLAMNEITPFAFMFGSKVGSFPSTYLGMLLC